VLKRVANNSREQRVSRPTPVSTRQDGLLLDVPLAHLGKHGALYTQSGIGTGAHAILAAARTAGGNNMFAKDSGLLQGTLELLVLKTLSWGPMHGYGVARWIEGATSDVLRVEEGSLYPALYRMTRKGWIKGDWGVTENNRRAKFYALTAEGRRQLTEQVSTWERLSAAVSSAVRETQAPGWAR
jgi:PadR family transcriptional regulator, regulatory protein PadR